MKWREFRLWRVFFFFFKSFRLRLVWRLEHFMWHSCDNKYKNCWIVDDLHYWIKVINRCLLNMWMLASVFFPDIKILTFLCVFLTQNLDCTSYPDHRQGPYLNGSSGSPAEGSASGLCHPPAMSEGHQQTPCGRQHCEALLKLALSRRQMKASVQTQAQRHQITFVPASCYKVKRTF